MQLGELEDQKFPVWSRSKTLVVGLGTSSQKLKVAAHLHIFSIFALCKIFSQLKGGRSMAQMVQW